MKHIIYYLVIAILLISIPDPAPAQKRSSGADAITSTDLENHVSFLASPLLMGRMNGSPELETARQYIAANAELIGLKPANGTSYFQPYSVLQQRIDPEKTMIQIIPEGKDTITIKEPVYPLFPQGPADFTLDGEVVFAGYGLWNVKYGYNDFENTTTEDRILMVMSRSPTSEDGQRYLFEGDDWSDLTSILNKFRSLLFAKSKAVLFVMDPKSGYSSLEEAYPGISHELSSIKSLRGEESRTFGYPGAPRIMFVDRSVADELLKGTGTTLEELQIKIDKDLKPSSFTIPGKKLRITEAVTHEELMLSNVAAYIEGSDPVLKNEFVVFSGHYDHIGTSGGIVNSGADDNASGCAALLSIAKAFQSLEKKPLRSVLFLWVSGEELGLFGSKSYMKNPLVPLEKTVADINMDMIGRVKEIADSTSATPVTGPDEVFVITGKQSRELMSIAEDVDRETPLDFDYSLSGRDHPLQLFSRSDHYNFVIHDIPVLFFTTGLHSDYHSPGDVIGKIDFKKMELITRAMFRIGYIVADRKTRLKVNNPYSKW